MCAAAEVKSRQVPERPPWPFLRALAVVQHDLSVHHHVGDSLRVGHRLLESGGVAHPGGVETHQNPLHSPPGEPPGPPGPAPRQGRGPPPPPPLPPETNAAAPRVARGPRPPG